MLKQNPFKFKYGLSNTESLLPFSLCTEMNFCPFLSLPFSSLDLFQIPMTPERVSWPSRGRTQLESVGYIPVSGQGDFSYIALSHPEIIKAMAMSLGTMKTFWKGPERKEEERSWEGSVDLRLTRLESHWLDKLQGLGWMERMQQLKKRSI